MPRPLSLDEIVRGGLCIGCGLCESVAGSERVQFVTTPEGRERPQALGPLDDGTLREINAVCPGTRVDGAEPQRLVPGTPVDPVWGPVAKAVRGHASDPEVRFRGASGGVLTALGRFLLASGRVEVVVHVAAAARAPMRTERQLSFDPAGVLTACGSRYGPAAPLRDFSSVLDAGRPFALIAKPCDIGAVRNLARRDQRVDRLMRYALTMICGGASELDKSRELLEDFGVRERDLTLFRYRGHGSPGATRIETRDGAVHELTYTEMWEDEARWRLQSRCKICPDPNGEAADLVAGDAWPQATPVGEDPGFNSIVARTAAGHELLEAAVSAGVITVCEPITPRDLDNFNPQQVVKRRAVGARLAALALAGSPVPRVRRLRISQLALLSGPKPVWHEVRGTWRRRRAGRLSEPSVTAEAMPLRAPR